MKGVSKFFRRLGAAIREERKLVIGVPGLALAILGLLVGVSQERQREMLGPDGPKLFDRIELALSGLLLALFIWFLIRVLRRLRSTLGAPLLRPSAYHCKVLASRDEARYVNVQLVHQIFPHAPTPADQGLAAHDKNPRRLVGLVHTETDKIVGWASLWPVTAKVGLDIEAGRRNDDDLDATHLLPTSRNSSARYLVLRAFAILEDYRSDPENLALKLGSFVLAHIVEEFICSSDRTIRLLAIAYTQDGEKLCKALGLNHNKRFADYGAELGKKPVFVADVTMKDLCRRLGSG